MALRLNSVNAEAALVNTALPRSSFTAMCWWMPLDVSGWRNIFYFEDSFGDRAAVQTSGTTLYGNSASGSTIANGAWHHITLVNTATVNHLIYLNGVLDITDTSSSVWRETWNYAQLGRWSGASDYADARFACVKIWSAVLTLEQIQVEMQTIRPVFTNNLFSWHPTFFGTERIKDYSGNGYDLTDVNTLTDEDPPPVSWGSHALVLPYYVSAQADLNMALDSADPSKYGWMTGMKIY